LGVGEEVEFEGRGLIDKKLDVRVARRGEGKVGADRLSFPGPFAHPTSVSISIETIITHCDLALVRNMGSHPGDELQVVNAHLFFLADQGVFLRILFLMN
jgi:hypothetical protein